ncbi:hypothetical protein A2715_00725 [Candidatus Woesebacteria bacterium RIFCSPHIGHO2_01_FULL_39_32]|uniref:Phosphoribosyltransferase domain-containing protein n=1 Tax=Candidatus Woesebacteria bacterium RIFCSPLOWO2_01_FULL_39_25 TaxID=1802521 RepID=A0A1F8BK69_9BACT|nr:MAG: hypothetical protein A2124_03525 [Candidatus Woesebacteria bacterium GWB1_37_5]OGM24439.1 MAG: hypothetical protein A2715_00725 [Candidatus Woesebacteria bacterium RIFCSPHIGHO2_01_FULL_39_32]OGM35556.1 MAG: hypothetical protein A3F01_02545 [Candidatus Woesebacteria bacterium RIFCSPHIGHO2_12_FULL_38_11]OGM63745.1 MAG: hypothetical protein A2893_02060 [Candidatus Woesebacteria bacterium RIFCSPLOWO2_01_FULL_39_25]
MNLEGISRKLPIVSIAPKVKVASFNLLGDKELVCILAKKMMRKLQNVDFDYLVGPEVKVVPLLHELSKLLKKDRYIVCRKEIHGYMILPIKSHQPRGLVLNGLDAALIKNKKIIIVDDVVSTGATIHSVEELMQLAKAKVVSKIAVFKQGDRLHPLQKDVIFLGDLPVFTS